MKEELSSEFIESLGIIFQDDGLPRIAGRMLGYLILSEGAQSFSQLVDSLQVSKGSVSTNTRLLVDLGAVERTARPGDRQDYFRLANAPYTQLLERAVERNMRAKRTLERLAERFGGGDPAISDRIGDLVFFFSAATDATAETAKRMRDRRKT